MSCSVSFCAGAVSLWSERLQSIGSWCLGAAAALCRVVSLRLLVLLLLLFGRNSCSLGVVPTVTASIHNASSRFVVGLSPSHNYNSGFIALSRSVISFILYYPFLPPPKKPLTSLEKKRRQCRRLAVAKLSAVTRVATFHPIRWRRR